MELDLPAFAALAVLGWTLVVLSLCRSAAHGDVHRPGGPGNDQDRRRHEHPLAR